MEPTRVEPIMSSDCQTLAYYGMAKITAVKSFIVQAPGSRKYGKGVS